MIRTMEGFRFSIMLSGSVMEPFVENSNLSGGDPPISSDVDPSHFQGSILGAAVAVEAAYHAHGAPSITPTA